jgi:HD superfamily phosphodiesterase
MDIEKEFQPEFDLLKNEGRLIGDWFNIYNHCKLEGEVAIILSRLVDLNEVDSKILIKAAILHDWYKRYEIEQAKGLGITEYKNSENDSYNKLLALGVEKRIVEVAHSVGSLSLEEIMNSQDLIKKLMHFIDDICLGDRIAEIDERIDYNERKYPQLNEEGRKMFEGRTYFEMQRVVGKQIQSEIEDILKIEPNSLISLIKKHWESSKKSN